MMRAIAIAAFLLSLLAPLSPAHAQFRQLIEPFRELFQPKPKSKPNPQPRPAEPVPLPPMNPLQQPEEAAPAQETGEEAAVEPPVPLPPMNPLQQPEEAAPAQETGEEATVKPPVPLPPMKPQQETEAPPTPPSQIEDEAAAAGKPPGEEPAKEEWSQAEIVKALSACITRLGPIVAEVEPLSPIKEKRCGTAAPVKLKRLGADPGVEISPAATLNCDMVLALDTWIRTVVQPAAERLLGTRIVRLHNASSYSCRNRNNAADGPISEHAFANALDVSGFITADGREITPLKYWGPIQREIEAARRAAAATGTEAQPGKPVENQDVKGGEKNAAPPPDSVVPSLRPLPPAATPDQGKAEELGVSGSPPAAAPAPEQIFLREIHKAACGIFGTVLGPEANNAHKNHFHFDLAPRRHGAYCE